MHHENAIGVVKFFDSKRGWGFIIFEEKEYFCHYSEINGDGFRLLKDDEVVNFEPHTQEKGLVARNITRL